MLVLGDVNLSSKVADVIENGNWKWPVRWNTRIPLVNIPNIIVDKPDVVLWKDRNGVLKEFTVNNAWEGLRHRAEKVAWYHLVWFPHCIPKHAFLLWLVMHRKLKTQDTLRHWDFQNGTVATCVNCPLCEAEPDSHKHLFFECLFSQQVWQALQNKSELHLNVSSLDIVLNAILPMSSKRSVLSVISKLVLAAVVYFIWNEKNMRLFQQKRRTKEKLIEIIFSTVRLKLLTFRFRKTKRVEHALLAWDLPPLLYREE